MIIEQRFHRAIIGQKGEKIKEVRDKFPEVSVLGCMVYFSNRMFLFTYKGEITFLSPLLSGHHQLP